MSEKTKGEQAKDSTGCRIVALALALASAVSASLVIRPEKQDLAISMAVFFGLCSLGIFMLSAAYIVIEAMREK